MEVINNIETIKKEQWFPHGIDKVWAALTETDKVSQWLVPTNFKGIEGAAYQLSDPKDECNVVSGVVTKAEPYTLVYTWIDEGWKNIETTVEWELQAKDGGTLVKLNHSGISAFEPEVAKKQFANFSGGWKHCFLRLEEVLKQN